MGDVRSSSRDSDVNAPIAETCFENSQARTIKKSARYSGDAPKRGTKADRRLAHTDGEWTNKDCELAYDEAEWTNKDRGRVNEDRGRFCLDSSKLEEIEALGSSPLQSSFEIRYWVLFDQPLA